MIKEEVQAIVTETWQQLKKNDLLKNTEDIAYAEMSERLFEYYKCKTGEDAQVYNALHEIRNDPYCRIIQLYYRDGLTIAKIAEFLFVCDTTVKRCKKRLVLQLHLLCS